MKNDFLKRIVVLEKKSEVVEDGVNEITKYIKEIEEEFEEYKMNLTTAVANEIKEIRRSVKRYSDNVYNEKEINE